MLLLPQACELLEEDIVPLDNPENSRAWINSLATKKAINMVLLRGRGKKNSRKGRYKDEREKKCLSHSI
jgi:hypothetical protein